MLMKARYIVCYTNRIKIEQQFEILSQYNFWMHNGEVFDNKGLYFDVHHEKTVPGQTA